MREAPLTMTMLAALAPPELNIDFTLVDESIDTPPLEENFDLVAISAITGTAKRAYQLADHFRERKIPVVLGGVHVTLVPDEAKKHADSIVTGPAEQCWPRLLRDFAERNLQSHYQDPPLNTAEIHLPTPRYDLLRRSGYMVPDTIMATRGCRQSCHFCTIPALGVGYAKRPIAEVIKDIQRAPSKYIVFNDVSLVDDVEYATELFRAMIPFKKRWGGLATTKLGKNPQLIELMGQSGCSYLLFGFESFSQDALKEIRKGFNFYTDYQNLIDNLHHHNISVQGCFIFGFDHDDASVFEATVERINDLKIDIPRFSILTPYPGTGLYQTLQKQKRILSYNWDDYDTMHVVFQPQHMSPQELYDGFKWAYRHTFTMWQSIGRTKGWKLSSFINFMGNMNYRKFSQALVRHPRYAQPYSGAGEHP